jgi:hypothetical protein
MRTAGANGAECGLSESVLVAMGLVMIPGAIWVFSRAEKRAKRLGLLKRSG